MYSHQRAKHTKQQVKGFSIASVRPAKITTQSVININKSQQALLGGKKVSVQTHATSMIFN